MLVYIHEDVIDAHECYKFWRSSMYHRKQRGKVEKMVNCGVCLYPSTVKVLEKYRGEFSRSGFLESILLDYFEAMEEVWKEEQHKGE